MDHNQKVRVQPRMSAAQLGRYLVVGAGNRETIVRNAKFPQTFQTVYYQQAENAIRRVLLRSGDVAQLLDEAQQHISGAIARTEHAEHRRDVNVDAVRRFGAAYPKLPLDNLTRLPLVRLPHLVVEGVTISVKPVVALERHVRGNTQRGALLVVYGRTQPIADESGQAIGQMLRLALEAAGYTDVRSDLCLVVDLASSRYYRAPSRGLRVQRDIDSACREIAVRWPRVEPGERSA